MSEDKRTDETPVDTPEAPKDETPQNEAEDIAVETSGVDAPETGTETESSPQVSDAEVIAQLREQLAAEEKKAADYLDKLQRTAAEFQNSRRRLENQLNEETERANAALIMRLLPVLDDFDLAFQNAANETSGEEDAQRTAWLEGFRQIQKKLTDVLTDHGVVQIASDGHFDPMQHEAVTSEPNESVPSGHIIATLRAGYEYKGRVLRPALVRVAM